MSELVFLSPSDPNEHKLNPFDYFEARLRIAGRDFAELVRHHLRESIVGLVLMAVGSLIYVWFFRAGTLADKARETVAYDVIAPAVVALALLVWFWIRGSWRLHAHASSAAATIPLEPFHRRFFASLCLLFICAGFAAAGLWIDQENNITQHTKNAYRAEVTAFERLEARRIHLQGESDYRRMFIWGGNGQRGLWHEIYDKNGYINQIADLRHQLHDAENKPPVTITKQVPVERTVYVPSDSPTRSKFTPALQKIYANGSSITQTFLARDITDDQIDSQFVAANTWVNTARDWIAKNMSKEAAERFMAPSRQAGLSYELPGQHKSGKKEIRDSAINAMNNWLANLEVLMNSNEWDP